MSHGASSAGVSGLPRFGFKPGSSASAPPPPPAANAMRPAAIVETVNLRIDMADPPLGVDRPAGDGVEVLAGECENRRRLRGLAALRHELLAGRLHVAG